MAISRRDFMKFVGVSVSSLLLTNCIPTPTPTCYVPALPPSPTALNDPKARLRKYWLSFGELAARTQEESSQSRTDNTFGQELVANHRSTLDELVSNGSLTQAVADLIQEAYDAAVYHVWRSNALMTCYEPMMIDYAPVSAQVLVQQAKILDELSSQGSIDPQTLEDARAALEHDMAFYSLTNDEVNALYQSITTEWQAQQQSLPSFEQVELEITPDAKAAAEFILGLLMGK